MLLNLLFSIHENKKSQDELQLAGNNTTSFLSVYLKSIGRETVDITRQTQPHSLEKENRDNTVPRNYIPSSNTFI